MFAPVDPVQVGGLEPKDRMGGKPMIDVHNQPDANTLALSPLGGQIRRLILERCGLYFRDHERKGLEDTVCKRMVAIGVVDFKAYLTLLQESQEEFCELLNLLTVRHTYFYRNEPQFKALQHTVLPQLIEAKRRSAPPGGPTLNIWSAGCSTGEEPYSLAIAVHKAIPDIADWKVSIHATDVSTQALATAQTGCFCAGSMQLVSETDRAAFFDETITSDGKHRFKLRDSIRRLVQFRYLNLQEDAYPENMDLIFCRNVMIYFDRPTVTEMVKRFSESLRVPGYFFIGYSETLQGISTEFKLTLDHEGVYYCKHDPQEVLEAGTATKKKVVVPPTPPVPDPSAPASVSPLVTIQEAVTQKDYDRALRLIGRVDAQTEYAVEAYYHAAFIYTNQGAYARAHDWLDKILALDPLFAPAYFLAGTVAIEEEDGEAAQIALKKAIYLDPAFPMAHMALATAYQKQDCVQEAIREYHRTIKLVADQPPEQEVHHAGGFNYGTLLSICYNNIERLQNDL